MGRDNILTYHINTVELDGPVVVLVKPSPADKLDKVILILAMTMITSQTKIKLLQTYTRIFLEVLLDLLADAQQTVCGDLRGSKFARVALLGNSLAICASVTSIPNS